jgi:hypothetical protein
MVGGSASSAGGAYSATAGALAPGLATAQSLRALSAGDTARSAPDAARVYSLRGIYFKRDWFEGTADCLTAAHARGLPLEVCK